MAGRPLNEAPRPRNGYFVPETTWQGFHRSRAAFVEMGPKGVASVTPRPVRPSEVTPRRDVGGWDSMVSVETIDYNPQTHNNARFGKPDALGAKMNATANPHFIGDIFTAGIKKVLKP